MIKPIFSLISHRSVKALQYRTIITTTKPNVWVVTNGGIESTLQAATIGKHLGNLTVKTIVSTPLLRLFPLVIQKYIVDWGLKRKKENGLKKLPWYLEGNDDQLDGPLPDYVVCSGDDAVPGCLQVIKSFPSKHPFSVFLGFTNLPFIHFDQVVIPKYEANVKMAKLGPLAQQKNCIVTEAPIVDSSLWPMSPKSKKVYTDLLHHLSFQNNSDLTVIVIGGHTSQCRWYTENALNLVDNMKRMVTQLDTNLLVIYTERTTPLIKTTIQKNINKSIPDHATRVVTWDSTISGLNGLEKMEAYDNLIQQASRVVLTADLDYITAHATMKSIYYIWWIM
ncbi:uncharacterized protein BX664DRAFT_65376 [Halteromyces radiatus]|uniref:uncharacterized protein n=1 Tax=Halteromyces radiatus TaxID=101107 RepID=UPI0022200B3D|nr:uncharacterized protein BX664DRAFT_65376 [Halteromyces radiatus]KAI8096739.1 hypothetical protein BX664DRAFT_65376 [Halteromyces radiatus]